MPLIKEMSLINTSCSNTFIPCVNKLAPDYLCSLFCPRFLPYDLRDTTKKLYLLKPRTDFLKGSFSYSGASLWNDLPEELQTASSLNSFKKGII